MKVIKEGKITPKYRKGDIVYKGDSTGYTAIITIKGSIDNFPKSLDRIVRNIYFISDGIYKAEVQSNDLSEKGYKDLWGWFNNELNKAGLSSVEESLEEDTIKTKDGKWTNKGKEGTHGKFKTKKEADAQRKAMFAQGFHEELDTEELDFLADYDYIYNDVKLDNMVEKLEEEMKNESIEESEEEKINREADEFVEKRWKKAYECYCGQIKTRFGELDESNILIDEDALTYASSKCNYDYNTLKDRLEHINKGIE